MPAWAAMAIRPASSLTDGWCCCFPYGQAHATVAMFFLWSLNMRFYCSPIGRTLLHQAALADSDWIQFYHWWLSLHHNALHQVYSIFTLGVPTRHKVGRTRRFLSISRLAFNTHLLCRRLAFPCARPKVAMLTLYLVKKTPFSAFLLLRLRLCVD